MNIMVHYPKDRDGMQALAAKAAALHAEAVTAYITKLSCPGEQKWKLLNAVKEGLSKES